MLLSDNGTHRSLCANLAAANLFTKDHIEVPENLQLIEKADFYYITVIKKKFKQLIYSHHQCYKTNVCLLLGLFLHSLP